jgi:hypothetical protein
LVGDSAEVAVTSADGRLMIRIPSLEETFAPLDKTLFFRIRSIEQHGCEAYEVTPDDLGTRLPLRYTYRAEASTPAGLRGAGLYLTDDHGKLRYLGGTADSADLTVSAESFRLGCISMLVDTVAPSIGKVRPSPNGTVRAARPLIRASVVDSLSGVEDDVEIWVDSLWLVPMYDPEKDLVSARPHFDLAVGNHVLEIIARDRAGNERHYQGTFRYAP